MQQEIEDPAGKIVSYTEILAAAVVTIAVILLMYAGYLAWVK